MAARDSALSRWMNSLDTLVEKRYGQAAAGMKLLANPPAADVGTSECEVAYKKDKMRLLHYAGGPQKKAPVPVLLVYALINRPYILDLQQDRSVVQTLLRRGLDVYMIDWGKPTDGDRFLGLEDYVERYMDDCFDVIMERSGQESISVLGYCIGGYLASVYASLHPERVRNIALMASPLDFGIEEGMLHLWTKAEYFNPELVVEAFGNAPSEFLNSGFTMLDPLGNTVIKYMGLAENIEDKEFVDMFFRMEKWLSDGIPVAGAFYIDLIRDGYQRNLFVKNQLRVNSRKASVDNLTMPMLAIVAEKDYIVPPSSTLGLLKVAPSKDKTTFAFPTGHIGLSVGSGSHKDLWPKVAKWFLDHSKTPSSKR